MLPTSLYTKQVRIRPIKCICDDTIRYKIRFDTLESLSYDIHDHVTCTICERGGGVVTDRPYHRIWDGSHIFQCPLTREACLDMRKCSSQQLHRGDLRAIVSRERVADKLSPSGANRSLWVRAALLELLLRDRKT